MTFTPSDAPAAVARVIVGAGGSPGRMRALRYAAGLARSNDAALLPVIAWEPPGRNHLGRGVPSGYLRRQWRDLAWQQLQDALVAVWGEVPCSPLVQPHVEMGRPGWVLVSLASRAGDVLVIGAGRRNISARIACSRVSRYCLAHARCPVLAIPPPELRRSRLRWMLRFRSMTAEQLLRGR
jgi:nucleotide-binding universal stress UspA family protein